MLPTRKLLVDKNIGIQILFISWMVFVTLSSLFSFSGVSTSRFSIPHLDKVVHFTFYFVMVFLGFLALRREDWSQEKRHSFLWKITVTAIGYGIIIEVLQHVATVDRQGDLFDALANSTGAIAAMMLLRYLFLRRRSLK